MQSGMNADSLVTIALQQAKNGQKEAAKRSLAHALKLDPAHPRAWFLLSHLLEDPQQITALFRAGTQSPAQQPYCEKASGIVEREST